MFDRTPASDRAGMGAEAAVGLGVIGILFVLLIPLPPVLLDVLIASNLAFGTLVLLITLSARSALELSTYPTLLLLTTLFRLALNVASTRLILLRGEAGNVIEAFGDFVVGGELIVGVTIFVILIVIQFIVITKGATRISEVAARFTLDAMPGKQMAIDADLNAGLISEDDARGRRDAVRLEAEFHGAMDGASKFVRGDAIAALVITVINVIGGVVIGMGRGMTAGAALEKYSILTIGDGLVSQTPALIIAVSAGILVTKNSSANRFGTDLMGQLFGNPRALALGAVVAGLMAFVPGFPAFPFIGIAIGLGYARSKALRATERPSEPEVKAEPRGTDASPEALRELLDVDRMGVEVGYRLIRMVDGGRPGGLLDHITTLRRQFATSHGLLVPPIRLKDNLGLAPNAYRVLIAGQEVARGMLYPDRVMAMNPGCATREIEGVRSVDPTFGMPAVWIRDAERTDAETSGYTVIDPVGVLVTHLTETVRRHAAELLTRDDTKMLLDRLEENAPAVVKELVPDVLGVGDIQRVLQNLLRERLPVRNLGAILECLADRGRVVKDPDQLSELVRQRLGRTLCELHGDDEGVVRVIVVEPGLEAALETALGGQEGAAVTPAMVQRVQESAVTAYTDAVKAGHDPIVLTRATVRRYLAEVLGALTPPIAVLSYPELQDARRVEPVGRIDANSNVLETATAAGR